MLTDFLQKAEDVYRQWQDQQQRSRETLKLEDRLENLKSGKKSRPPNISPTGLQERLDALHGPGHAAQREREEAAKKEWLLGVQTKQTTTSADQTEQLLQTALEAHTLAKKSRNAALNMQMNKMRIDPHSLLNEAKTVQDEVGGVSISCSFGKLFVGILT